jgi:hypothetical protein
MSTFIKFAISTAVIAAALMMCVFAFGLFFLAIGDAIGIVIGSLAIVAIIAATAAVTCEIWEEKNAG